MTIPTSVIDHSRSRLTLALCALLLTPALLLAADPLLAQDAQEDDPTVVRGRLVGKPGHRHVRAVRPLIRDAGRLDWTLQGDRIAFDRPGVNGFYGIWDAFPDGTVGRCITCDNFTFHKQHLLAPVWHPSGEYLVVQVQLEAKRLKMEIADLATPFRGLHSELWVITKNGKQAWQLTNSRDRGGAVLDPLFSHEGGRLLWSERTTTRGGRSYGQWTARVAEFNVRRGIARLGKIKSYQAGEHRGLELAQSFTPDDRGLLIAGIPFGQGDDGLDLVRLELDSGAWKALTESPQERDAVARYSPDSRFIVWASDRNLKPISRERRRLPWRGDLWIMGADGGTQERLTFFNHPESDHYLGEAMITDLAWSPEGDRLAIHVVSAGMTVEQAIWVVVLDPSFKR